MSKDGNVKPVGRRAGVEQVGLGLVVGGLLLFLPITQYLVYSSGGAKLGWFALHPTMQSIGITAAVLSIQALQTSPPTKKEPAFKLHQILVGGVGFPLFLLGFYAIYIAKSARGAKHFTTWHGKLGAAAFIWIVVQATVGGVVHRLADSVSPKWKWTYKYHRLSGYLMLPLTLIVAHTGGAWSDWSIKNSTLGARIAAFDVGLAMVAVGLMLRMRPSKMKIL